MWVPSLGWDDPLAQGSTVLLAGLSQHLVDRGSYLRVGKRVVRASEGQAERQRLLAFAQPFAPVHVEEPDLLQQLAARLLHALHKVARGHIFVHYTKRQAVCDALLTHLDSLKAVEPEAKIIAMGDFNDTPQASSIVRLCERAGLDNLSKNISGTIRFKGKWETIDLLLASPPAAAIIGVVEAYKPDFLLEEDKAFLGRKPRRTNVGPRYNGGASDHLPIVANLSAWHLSP